MLDKQTIQERLSQELPFIREKYGVKKIGLFGSYAAGKASKQSDIDLLVEFSRPIGLFDYIRLENYLGDRLDEKVDLVSKKGLKPIIKEKILKSVAYV